MNSIRTKLLLAFATVAMLAVGGTALAGLRIFEDRASELADDTFDEARGQLTKMLHLRYEVFRALSDLSYVLPVMRQVTAESADESDFGLGSPEDDANDLKTLHQNLVDADWGWAAKASQGFFAVADSKGRLLYASADKSAFGQDTRKLTAVSRAFNGEFGHSGAMVIDARDPKLSASGMVTAKTAAGMYVVFARSTVLGGQPRAVFIQGWQARNLLSDLRITDKAARLALLAPDGTSDGDLPADCLRAASKMKEGERGEVSIDGHRWLVQRVAVKGLSGQPIADIVLAYNLDQRLATLLEGAGALRFVAVLMLLIALGLGFFLASRIALPIRELSSAAEKVADGDLDVTVDVQGKDEIGQLGSAFNRMTVGLRERDRIKRTFKRHVAPDVVEYLLTNTGASNRVGDRKRLTMLFSDLVGFTSISEERQPEEVVNLLNGYLSRVSEALTERKGTLDKYMGDGVMAFFGAPMPLEDDALLACLAALDHVRIVADFNAGLSGDNAPVLDVRVGVHKGDVIVGSIGGENAQDYTVIGDAVNLAARLEPVNKVYGTKVLCSETVWEEVRDHLDGREIDMIRVKGKQNAVRIFEVLGPKGWLAEHPDVARCAGAYAVGLAAYRKQAFDEAVRAFDEALAARPTEGPSSVLRERALHAAPSLATAAWSGVFNLDHK
ncbi:MAG: HAMP domain-containing protein [Myxococcales bacterium]|nr:HAMP domain-containing protein [Myxococcales bacterium]